MKNEEFSGFDLSRAVPIPDNFFDQLLSELSGSEVKVMLYIFRRTRGFGKETDAIPLSQFHKGIQTHEGKQLDKGCGIKDIHTIITALASLERKNCITTKKGREYDGGYATTIYTIITKEGIPIQAPSPKTNMPENVTLKRIYSSPNSDRIAQLQTMPYQEYLLTPEWQQKRMKALRFAQFRCQLCNSSQSLNVHHRTYERRGKELLGDLITLCNDCHTTFHWNRELEEGNGHGR